MLAIEHPRQRTFLYASVAAIALIAALFASVASADMPFTRPTEMRAGAAAW